MKTLKNRTCITFDYYLPEDAQKLEKALKLNNIDYVCYYDACRITFKVDKSGYTWDNVYKIINSIHSAMYKKVKACILNNKEYVLIN